jgi:hypothetical protein
VLPPLTSTRTVSACSPIGYPSRCMDSLLVASHCTFSVSYVVCALLSPMTLFRPLLMPVPPADFTTTMGTLAGAHPSVILAPLATPELLSHSHLSCCSPQAICVSGASDLANDGAVPIPCLHLVAPIALVNLLFMLRPLQTAMIKFSSHISQPVLLWFRVIVMMRFLLSVLSYLSSTARPFVCPKPTQQASDLD